MIARLALLLVCVACAKSEPPAATDTAPKEVPIVWKSNLVPCTPETCGAYGENSGSMALESGDVSVDQDGVVRIRMRGYVDANGVRGSDRTLRVDFGRFREKGLQVVGSNPLLGTITTDRQGNFDGTVTSHAGTPAHVQRGLGEGGRIILTQPGVRSLFLTESEYKE